ncbi:hypothetical protein BH10BAC3_BH10BAC3_10730 [soil metagenome]
MKKLEAQSLAECCYSLIKSLIRNGSFQPIGSPRYHFLCVFTWLLLPGLIFPSMLAAQTPQGSLSANGPFCETGSGALTLTTSAGTAPFTVVYNDGVAERTVTDVKSGTPFSVFTSPVISTTTYTLISVLDAGGFGRTSGFTSASATITVKPNPDLAVSMPDSQNICTGSALTPVTLSSATAGATLKWSRSNFSNITGMPNNGSSNPITGSLVNATGIKRTTGFTATATNDGCTTNKVFGVQVNPPITNNTILGSHVSEVAVCGLTRQVTIGTPAPTGGDGVYTYQWQVSSTGNNDFTNIPGAINDTVVYSTGSSLYFRRIAYSGGCSNTSTPFQVSGSAGSTSSIVGACGGSGLDISVIASYAGAIYTLQRNLTGTFKDISTVAPITGTGKTIRFENNYTISDYRVTVTIPGNCTQIVAGIVPITETTLPAAPSSTSATPTIICSGASANIIANITGASASDGASVRWYLTPEEGTPLNSIAVASGAPFAVNPDTTTTYYAKTIYTATGCKSSGRTPVTITVNPKPVMTSADSVAICSGGTVNIPLTNNSGAASTYTWLATDNTNTIGESTTVQNTGILNNTITNNTSLPQAVLYTVTSTITATGCTGDPQQLLVSVDIVPVVASQTATVCSATLFTIFPADGGGSIIPATPVPNYTWASPSGTGFTGGTNGAGNSISGTLTNTSTNPAMATYQVTPASGACTGAPFSLAVTINPALAANMAIWTGAISRIWNNPANWSCNVLPDENTNVIIPAGVANDPQVNFNTTVRSITLSPAANVRVMPGVLLNVKGQ